MVILIAGGTGLIGSALTDFWTDIGHEVRILTRKPTNVSKGLYNWNFHAKTIDEKALANVDVIVNLTGAGIADKKWTTSRKAELISSRVEAAHLFAKYGDRMPTLKHYISASGINCYGYEQPERMHKETDSFGTDFLSTVVQKWEAAADTLEQYAPVTKLRIAVVLTPKGGALPRIAKTVKNYIGSALGSGKQAMPWISLHDLVRVFDHVIEKQMTGPINTVAANPSNAEFTKELAIALKKPLFLPNVPSFVLKTILGEMSTVVLDGVKGDNSKLVESGFQFDFPTLVDVFKDLREDL